MARVKSALGKGKYYQRVRSGNKSIPDSLLAALVRQKYHVVGEHSAAKLCHWASRSLRGEGECYKSRFYGIASHRCLQCTPVLLFCNHSCVFCWRMMPEKKMMFSDMPCGRFEWDGANRVAEGLVSAQKEIVSGFGGNARVQNKLYREALSPKHAAISLTGEPTMYPHLEKLLEEFHGRKMTTFLVTNGTFPERIAKWETLPTQLYVSMVAPNETVYRRFIRPASNALWKKYLRMLKLLKELGKRTRTVLRMTLARGVNDCDLGGYAQQIASAQPHYVEVKSMVYVGGARMEGRGLSLDCMLAMGEIEGIAQKLSEMTGYRVSDSHAPSRVVLLCRDEKCERERMIPWEK